MRRLALATLVVAWPLLSACGGGAPAPLAGARPPIVLVCIDTLRADRLPAYGDSKVDTPHIDALARDSVLFENAYTHVPLTLPAHASLFTGLLPPEHGVRDNLGYKLDAKKHRTVASLLKEAGYATGAAVSAWVIRGATGLGEGFDFYEDAIEAPAGVDVAGLFQRPGGETLDELLPWLERTKDQRPFVFFHIYEPHSPFDPPEPFKSRYAHPYDGEVAAADAIVGRLLEELKRLGLYDRSLLVLLADHGEGLWDHGEEFHGILLYREALHVPLLVKLPGQARKGERVKAPVPLSDVAPTLLQAAGVKPPPGVKGTSLLAERKPVTVYAETYYPRVHLGWGEMTSAVDDRHHLIEAPRPELYDVVADPRETKDLVGARTDVVASLRSALARFPSGFAGPEAASPEDVQRLAALGYLGNVAAATEGPRANPRDRIHVLKDVEAAFKLGAARRDAEAVLALRKILDGDPQFLDVMFELGRVYQRMGRHQDAYDTYVKAMQASPTMAPAISVPLARVCLELGRLDEAKSNAMLGAATNVGPANEVLARVALARDDLPTAESHLAQVKGDNLTEANAHLLRAEIEIRRGRPAGALAHLDAGERLVADKEMERPTGLSFLRGDALARLGRHQEAAVAFEREIADHPVNRQAYARLAIVYGLLHRTYGEVDRLLERMWKASPDPASAELAAQTMEQLGDTRAARRWRGRARGPRPGA